MNHQNKLVKYYFTILLMAISMKILIFIDFHLRMILFCVVILGIRKHS